MEGVSIGPYRIVRKLGEGGMGAVWLGEHQLLGRRAAIKVLLPIYSANQGIVQRFFNEARAVTAVADPGIVQVFDFGQHTDGSAFLVMEFLEGEAMDARLKRIGRFSPVEALRLMKQIATSLSAAHAKGVIHRDLKPENLFIVGDPAVTGGERPKILDFGIAKLAGDEPGKVKTRTGVLMGTPVYMSPEQCRGATSVDHRSDVYALGCVLFTMLCGRPPFEGEGSGDIIIAHVRDQPPTPSTLVPGLPPMLDALVLRCLEKDPAARFQSMAELAQAIAAIEAAIFGYDYRHSQPIVAPTYPGATTPYPGATTPYPGVATPYPSAPTPANPQAVTTLGSSVGEAEPASPPPRRRVGLVIGGVIAAAAIAGGGFALFGGGSKPAATPTTATTGSAIAPTGAIDAGTTAAVEGTDAAAEVAVVVDAGVAADAAPEIAAETNDAGTERRGKRRGKRGDGNGSSSGSGFVDRGD